MNIHLLFQICLTIISIYIIVCGSLLLIGRMLDNGFSLKRAIKDEINFRINNFKYHFWVKLFKKDLGNSIGFKTEQYEFRDSVVYSLSIFFKDEEYYFSYYPKEHNSWLEINPPIENLFKQKKPLYLNYRNRDL